MAEALETPSLTINKSARLIDSNRVAMKSMSRMIAYCSSLFHSDFNELCVCIDHKKHLIWIAESNGSLQEWISFRQGHSSSVVTKVTTSAHKEYSLWTEVKVGTCMSLEQNGSWWFPELQLALDPFESRICSTFYKKTGDISKHTQMASHTISASGSEAVIDITRSYSKAYKLVRGK